MLNFPSRLDKCRGAMIATVIGDALGWPNEDRSGNTSKKMLGQDKFVSWKRRTGGRFYNHVETILAGEYSDDTQMVLSVARSIIAGNWESFFKNKELPFWCSYERGGGKNLLRVAKFYKTGKEEIWQSQLATDYFQAGGNGAAMRILPHVIATENSHGGDGLFVDVVKDCLITHGHPRAVLGATCYAYALNWLLNKNSVLEYGELVSAVKAGAKEWGKYPENIVSDEWQQAANRLYDYRELWNQTLERMLEGLDFIDSSLQKGLMVVDSEVLTHLNCFGKEKGAGDVAILAAIYLASKYANNPVIGIKTPALMAGTDSDTIASITGGLLGMLCGLEQIPLEWRTVQDYECIIQITDILTSADRSAELNYVTSKEKERETEWDKSPIGYIHFLHSQTIQCGKKTSVNISAWKTSLGQTLYIKRYQLKNTENEDAQPTKSISQAKTLATAVKKYFFNKGLEFAFLGENYALVDNSHKYNFDILYFNRTLSCLVAVELKIGNQIDGTIRQLQSYLNALDKKLKKEQENPSMGIVVFLNQGRVQIETVLSEMYLPILSVENASKLLDKNDFEKYLTEHL